MHFKMDFPAGNLGAPQPMKIVFGIVFAQNFYYFP
jgi:hypothetical protein